MERYFIEQTKDLGEIKKGSTHVVKFKALPTIPEIREVKLSCGCLKSTFDSDFNELSIVYKAGHIPKQVKGNQQVAKSIVVYYKDAGSEQLYITAIKKQ